MSLVVFSQISIAYSSNDPELHQFRLVAQANDGERMPAILWTNTMTEKGVEKFLPKDDYIIQIWTTGTDPN